MTDTPKSPRPRRTHKLESRVTAEVYAAVEAYAIAHGYTLSTAINCVLLEWKAHREKVAHAQDP